MDQKVDQKMNAYSVTISVEADPPELQYGIISSDVDTAIVDVYEKYLTKVFEGPDDLFVSKLVVIPLRPAKIKRAVGTQELEFEALAAVKEGHLFYLDGSRAFIAKCRAIRNGDPKHVQCLIYNDTHEVMFL